MTDAEPPKRPLTPAELRALDVAAAAAELLASHAMTQDQYDELLARQAIVQEAAETLKPAYSAAQEFIAKMPDVSPILEPGFYKQWVDTRNLIEGVVAASTGTAADLRSLGSTPFVRGRAEVREYQDAPVYPKFPEYPGLPLKSGEEHAIERVEAAISRLANVAAGSADTTTHLAQLSKANLDQQGALVQALQGLHTTTIEGMRSNDRLQRTMLLLAVIVTMPVLGQFWSWSEPVRTWVLQELNAAFPWP